MLYSQLWSVIFFKSVLHRLSFTYIQDKTYDLIPFNNGLLESSYE